MEGGPVWCTWGLALTCPGALVSLVSCTSLGFTFLSEGGEDWVRWSPVPEEWVVGGCGVREEGRPAVWQAGDYCYTWWALGKREVADQGGWRPGLSHSLATDCSMTSGKSLLAWELISKYKTRRYSFIQQIFTACLPASGWMQGNQTLVLLSRSTQPSLW